MHDLASGEAMETKMNGFPIPAVMLVMVVGAAVHIAHGPQRERLKRTNPFLPLSTPPRSRVFFICGGPAGRHGSY
jgi:hypothetical protein